MHRCSNSTSSHGNMMGPCSCGLFHHHTQTNSSFSMLFSHHQTPADHHHHQMYPFASPPSSSSVDCTLSLGTPSTRLTQDDDKRLRHERRSVSNFCWDLLQPNKSAASSHHKNGSRGANSGGGGGGGSTNTAANDSLLARRCANCDTTSTPLWRNGPRGPKSLCNACGIRFKKEERRATAAAATSSTAAMEPSYSNNNNNHMFSHHNNSSWMNPHAQSPKMPCYSPSSMNGNEFRFIEDDMSGTHDQPDTGIPFLSWRLNITDRPSLVHDFTR